MRVCLVFVLWLAGMPLWALGPENVLIVANEDAEGSVEIAEYYAKHRGIDPARILKVKAPTSEEITREQFNTQLWKPIQEAVQADQSILAIVSTRGVPLKIRGTEGTDRMRGDFASVDGELALARIDEYPLEFAVPNPYFNSEDSLGLEHIILAVTRLDGPTVEIARSLVDKAIVAEALGASGKSYLDTGSMRDSGEGYLERDNQMRQVSDAWRRLQLDFHHDTEPEVMDLSTFENPLHYYGWYATTQRPEGEVRFRTGGICVHLHSFSASTIRRDNANWVGPLLSWNATASYGTVYEPFTIGFPYEHIFWNRIGRGFTFGEAGQMANQLLSWQATFIGCVLYRPYPSDFAETHTANRERLAKALAEGEMEEASGDVVWHCYQLLTGHAEALVELSRTAPTEALEQFNDLRFLVQDMGQQDWLAAVAEPLEGELQNRLREIRAQVAADLLDTAALERALTDWEGLPIHTELVEFRDSVADTQERAAARLLRRAQGDQRARRWLRAYVAASEAAAHRLAPSAAEAAEIVDSIRADETALADAKADADRMLEPVITRAQRDYDRGRFPQALRALGTDWRWMPESEQQKAAAALNERIQRRMAGD
jgi:uncharacterized protein (TIGR03790 family)